MTRKILILLSVLLVVAVAGALADSVRFTGDCNVRTGPGLGYSSIGTVNAYSSLPYKDESSVDYRGVTWYKVSFGGGTGWVSSVYSYITSGGGSYYDTVTAVSGDTYVRVGPGLNYASVDTLYGGQSAPYLGQTSYDSRGVAWYKIRWKGDDLWVSSRYVSLH